MNYRRQRSVRWPGVLFGVCLATVACAGQADRFLDDWLAAQARLKTWSAEFVQTRTLRALRTPIKTPGRLWFAAPDRFRWELGQPPRTIALRSREELLVIYPRLKRAERYTLHPSQTRADAAWVGALTLLDAGFATNRASLEERFQVRAVILAEDRAEVLLRPRAAAARRFLTQIRLVIARRHPGLLANEMRFADGSVIRNDFTHAKVNPDLPASLFHYILPSDFKVATPLRP